MSYQAVTRHGRKKKQNCGDRKKIGGCQGLRDEQVEHAGFWGQ